jgi:extracellular factor (EF) 3-hydroxypalmitic acid methyl ester biosynthesis protein
MLDRTYDELVMVDRATLDNFSAELGRIRASASTHEWMRLVTDVVRPHPIVTLFRHEPLTARAFQKPRGFAGDAVMLDLMYAEGPAPRSLSPLAQQLYLWIVNRPASRSVRYRCDLLATVLDAAAHLTPRPRVLAVACGHLREATRSYAMRCGAIDELVAFDQDAASLACVSQNCAELPVTPLRGSVRQILSGAVDGDFDLIYAAGLYDYLSEATAVALTRALVNKLRPNGRLLIGNFAPCLPDIGYMEAVMDWHLTYRDERAMHGLVAQSAGDDTYARTFRDVDGNVVYLDLHRRV